MTLPLFLNSSAEPRGGPMPMPCIVREAARTGNGERLKFPLNLHARRIQGEIRHLRQNRGYNSGQNDSKLAKACGRSGAGSRRLRAAARGKGAAVVSHPDGIAALAGGPPRR